ncbi:proteasome activator subunit 4 [Metschnikowia aff. pulcherrima]|uniref:Proteasome activator subunit 4 n=1 Tax=Metschnikowia aff. pulcherrima TaxID=2163413 RepID=A0A4P6XQP1_9ASCO|nr:proteasome activator subunit 4 [Metschnikowia aff. pulcherrima]
MSDNLDLANASRAHVRAPFPKRTHVLAAFPPESLRKPDNSRPFTPKTTQTLRQHRRPSYGTIETSRERHYNLDFLADPEIAAADLLNPHSRFYARPKPRLLDLPLLLPYETENLQERARFLSHIVAHLYIAVKTLDIQGLVAVSAKDLAALRDVPGFSDIDMALETNLFEMNLASSDEPEDAEPELEPEFGDDDFDENDELDSGTGSGAESDENDEFETGDLASQHKKLPRSAAVVSVRIWTHELLVWLQMKYDMPVSLRMALAKVYYAICCCRGQHVNLKIYVRAFETLTKNTVFLQEQGLSLDWQPVYNELALHFPSPDSLHEPLEKKDLNSLLKLGERASNFFSPDSLPILFRHIASYYSIPNATLVLWCMRILPQKFVANFSPDSPNRELDMRHYIAPVFHMWRKLSKSAGVDAHLTSVLGRLAMAYLEFLAKNASDTASFGPFGVFSLDQFAYITNTLLNSLSINVRKFGSMKTKFFHGFSCAIVFSMNGSHSLEKNGILDQLDALLNAIESYVHPSNSGDWAKPISKFISSLVYQFFKRFNMERELDGTLYHLSHTHKLPLEVVLRFVKSVLPLVRTGLQSKKESAIEEYLITLGHLAHLDAEATLGFMLLDLYESLQGVISTHRVITALRCMEELSRYFAVTPYYRMHLPRLLEMMLPGIDSNDLTKTMHTLDVFATVANFVPFADLTHGAGDPMLAMDVTNHHLEFLQRVVYDKDLTNDELVGSELEVEALKSATASFGPIVQSLAQRLFILLENIPDPAKSTGIEKYLCEMLPKLIYMVLESTSDEIFLQFRKEIVRFITENTIHPVTEATAEICGAVIKRDPAYLKTIAPLLIERIREEVSDNGAGLSRTGLDIIPRDQNLYWNLMILNSCVGNAGRFIVDVGDDLNSLSFDLMETVRGPAVFASTYLLNQILQGVTKIRLNESRLISPAYQKRQQLNETCWGGFQFDAYRFSKENLTFDWFLPETREIEFAATTFKVHITKALANILSILKSIAHGGNDTTDSSVILSDEIRANFLYLGYGLSGMSYLFDPSFDEDIPKLSDHRLESLQNRLTLLAQIREMKDSKLSETDGFAIETIHEDLKNIIEDIAGYQNVDLEGPNDDKDIQPETMNKAFMPSGMASSESLDQTKNEPKRPDLHALRMSVSPQIDDSARASPQLAGVEMSSMNPAITFRERRLYTSKYFFGDDIETRKADELYLQIHRMRHLVGKSLHYIFRFMQSHLSDNTKLFKHLLYTLNIWFSDVGRERLLDHTHSRISLSYVKELQKINRVRKPFTRFGFAGRIESLHLLRVALHATSRTMTDLDKVLIEDIVKLSCSTYTTIADPAQTTLVDAMKRVNGSYNVIVRSCLRHVTKAIQDKKFKDIESGLNVFEIKRIKSKLQNDFVNLRKYIEILHRCCSIDDKDVIETSHRSLKDMCGSIYPPRKICIIDHNLVDTIRPPDDYIDLEIKAVAYAKERKRAVYFEKLEAIESTVLSFEQTNTHWKTSSINLLLLTELQVEFEMSTRPDMFELLVTAARSDHPIVSRTALKGITKLLSKLETLSLFGYDMRDAYDASHVWNSLRVIDTRPHSGESYYETWQKEIRSEQPGYYVDYRMSRGWLFWDNEAVVVSNEPTLELKLSEADDGIIRSFSKCVTKEWFGAIINLWIADNDSNFAFQGTDVFITAGVVSLVSAGTLESITFDDILHLIESVYEKDEKSTHIVVCELITGILIASKSFNSNLVERRDAFLVSFLGNLFENDLTPETKHIWNIFAWWLPAHVDTRRFSRVRDVILKFQINAESDSAYMEASMLTYMKSFVSAITWATPNPNEIFDLCFNNVLNRYEAIRDQIGSLLVVTSFTFYCDSFADMDAFIEASHGDKETLIRRSINEDLFTKLMHLFDQIQEYKTQVDHLLTQDILKSNYFYCATTALSWLKQAFNTSVSIQYQYMVDTHIMPFLLDLMAMKEVCLLGNIDPVSAFKKVSQIPFEGESLQNVVAMLESYMNQDLSLLQYLALGEFTEVLYFKNLIILSYEQRVKILDFVSLMMYHKNPEVREAASSTFSGLIYTTPPGDIEGIVKSYNQRYAADLDRIRKRHRKAGFKSIPADDVITLHGATLGLGALVHAFSFISPPPAWIPSTLTILSNKASGLPGIVGRSAKETLGKFKKTRQDSWHIDSKVFTEEQMQDLEGVLWRSYFI